MRKLDLRLREIYTNPYVLEDSPGAAGIGPAAFHGEAYETGNCDDQQEQHLQGLHFGKYFQRLNLAPVARCSRVFPSAFIKSNGAADE
ncbi:hypothetical protein E4T56_gene12091 [Termitomyces sp. T112]|nr:hypothetical protein E4T56_gene12091 [Termitomyces sp. T112]